VRAEILIFDGFDELDAIGPLEVLRNAARLDGVDLEVRLVTLDEVDEVVAAHGTKVRPDGRPGEQPDLLVVPGGGWNARSPRGARAEAEREELPRAIARLHAGGTTVAGVCTGVMLLAAARLTGGRPAVTHHGALAELKATGTEIVEARVVDDGDLITSGGVTSGLDLALWIVERYFGARAALAVEAGMEYERRGVVWRR
jgi:transcriptional regulator GlxA family with amidase domain